MARMVLPVLFFCFLTVACAQTPTSEDSCDGVEIPDHDECNVCNKKGQAVTLRVRNYLKPPLFQEAVSVICTRYETLFYIMQQAADINKAFKLREHVVGGLDKDDGVEDDGFSVSYDHAGHPGFFVDAMNQVYSTWETDKSYWEILDSDLKHIPVGVSFYKPKPYETVTFNLTIYTGPHD